jgi:hypothetical protein
VKHLGLAAYKIGLGSGLAARWLLRYLEEHPETTIDEAALAASCLAALPGFGQADAARCCGPWPTEPLAVAG